MRDAKVMAEAITALTERVVELEARIPAARVADNLEAIEQHLISQLRARKIVPHAGIVDVATSGDRPAHHVASSVAESPGDEGAPFHGGVTVVVNLALGGLFVGVIVSRTDTHVTVDGGKRGGKHTVRLDQVQRCPDTWRPDR